MPGPVWKSSTTLDNLRIDFSFTNTKVSELDPGPAQTFPFRVFFRDFLDTAKEGF